MDELSRRALMVAAALIVVALVLAIVLLLANPGALDTQAPYYEVPEG